MSTNRVEDPDEKARIFRLYAAKQGNQPIPPEPVDEFKNKVDEAIADIRRLAEEARREIEDFISIEKLRMKVPSESSQQQQEGDDVGEDKLNRFSSRTEIEIPRRLRHIKKDQSRRPKHIGSE